MSMKTSSASKKDLTPFPKDREKAPVVLMLQPKGFKRVSTAEELAFDLAVVQKLVLGSRRQVQNVLAAIRISVVAG